MGGIAKDWNRPQPRPIGDRLGETLKPKGPLKPRVRAAIQRLEQQTAKLDAMLGKLRERDARIFERLVQATQQHDAHASRVLSGELAEVRKVAKVLGNAKMSLEKIELRLTTYNDLGDTVVTIMPTIGLMKNMKSSLAKFMPEADREIAGMGEMLGGFMVDSFSGDSAFAADAPSSEEADRILKEAAAVAESAVDAKFPDMPDSASAETKFV